MTVTVLGAREGGAGAVFTAPPDVADAGSTLATAVDLTVGRAGSVHVASAGEAKTILDDGAVARVTDTLAADAGAVPGRGTV